MSNKMAIEKGIPIPHYQRVEWPFKDMKVGDSFVAKLDRPSSRNSLYSQAKRERIKILCRSTPDLDVDEVRVWRIDGKANPSWGGKRWPKLTTS
jgi:hypothetical protein